MINEAKKKVLEDLIAAMEERELGDLKSKSPKFAKVDVKTNDPDMAEDIKEKLMQDVPAATEVLPECEDEEDDDLKKLLEMYKNIK